MKKALFQWLLILFLLPFSLHGEIPARVFMKVQGLLEKGKTREAEKTLFSHLGACESSCYLAYFLLGNAFFLDKNFSKAVSWYSKSISLKPDFKDAWINKGRALFEEKRYEDAAECFLKVYSMGGDSKFLYLSAVSFLYGGRYMRAYSALKRLIGSSTQPKDEWLDALFYSSLKARQLEDAESFLRAVASKNPYAWKVLGKIYMRKGDFRKALISYKVFSYCSSGLSKDDLLTLANLYAVQGIYEDAAKLYRRLGLSKKAGISYMNSHDFKEAEREFKKCGTSDPECWFLLGNLYYSMGFYEKAFSFYKRSASLGYREGRSKLMMGYCKASAGKFGEALSLFTSALKFPSVRREALEAIRGIKGLKRGS